MKCERNNCNKEATNIMETWVGSVPIYYKTCNKHAEELKQLERM